MGAPIDPELTADAEEGGDVGPLGAGAGTSLHRQSPPRAPAPGGRQAQRRRAPAAQGCVRNEPPRGSRVNARLLFHVGRVNLGAQRPVDPTFTRSVKVRSNTGRARWSAPTGCLRPG